MTDYQRVWWEQVRSDLGVYDLLEEAGAAPCHQLHYLHMVTEKLGKAYLWHAGRPPRKTHATFVHFLQSLAARKKEHRELVAQLFGFSRGAAFAAWVVAISPIAHALERLSPDLAGDNGPNAEYPWPRDAPTEYPAGYAFAVWQQLKETDPGRRLVSVVRLAVREFPRYA